MDNLVWSGVLLHNYMRTYDDEEGVPMTRSYAPPGNILTLMMHKMKAGRRVLVKKTLASASGM